MANKLPLSDYTLTYALGGLGEVGKNTYVVESFDTLVMIDAGVMFPEADLPGIDYVIPDYSRLQASKSKIKGLIITHGHEDHIGGIPFLIQKVSIPVIYAPKLAASLIRNKLQMMRIKEQVNIIEYDGDTVLQLGEFKVSFFRVTHSIPDSFGVCVDTPHGRVVSTGDFKIDLTPIGPDFELDKVAKMGQEGIDLLLSDSTNAESEGYTPSERNVLSAINDIFTKAPGRLIISTFSSNISRIQQIIEVALDHKRKVCVIGRSMENAVTAARGFGYIRIPEKELVAIEDIEDYKPSEVVVLCTGSQGEPMAVLSRIASGDYKQLHIMPTDTVVFSSSSIPGNGASIERVVNALTRAGANVLTNSIFLEIHSSGHPSKQELRLFLKLAKPKYFMPMHGEYRMLKIHAEIAVSLGMNPENCFVLENGQSLVMHNHKITLGPKFEADDVYIDGRNISDLSSAVLRDRKVLSDDGMVSVIVALDSKTSSLMIPPKIYTRGFVQTQSSDLIAKTEELVYRALQGTLKEKVSFSEIKQVIKTTVKQYLYTRTQRNPMVIPVIMNKLGNEDGNIS